MEVDLDNKIGRNVDVFADDPMLFDPIVRNYDSRNIDQGTLLDMGM